jgi:outer membrane receptor protein involved in Fe transport
VHRIRELQLRVDYSYSYLSNIVVVRGNQYLGAGSRAIHSVEAMSKLYFAGDHFLTASYTFLSSSSSDSGATSNIPSHWLSLGATFSLIKSMLDINANLLVTSAYADPNRYPSASMPMPGASTVENTTDLTFDRLTPVALLQLGFRLRFYGERLSINTQFYNVFNQRYYSPDPFYDLTPSQELSPTPAPGFSFFSRVTYRF